MILFVILGALALIWFWSKVTAGISQGVCWVGNLVIMAAAGLAIWLLASGFMPNYSEGTRAGVVTKISFKGKIYKSWEGNLRITAGNATLAIDDWQFTAANEEIAKRLDAASLTGERVQLHYHQYLSGPIWYDTEYVVDEMNIVPETKSN